MNAERWNTRYASKELVWSLEPNRYVAEELQALTPGKVLDLAAGEGRNAIWLAQQGWQATAVDYADVGLDKGRRLAAAKEVEVEWICADATSWTVPTEVFDAILICYLHLPETEFHQVMQHVRDALKPGGTFLLIGHDLTNLKHGHGGPQVPEILTTPGKTVAELPGFTIEKAEVVKRPVSTEPEHGGPTDAVALDTLVRALKPTAN
ncbi:MAG: class I SAM-dependent methyltransferase [Pseudomonadota bacterium]